MALINHIECKMQNSTHLRRLMRHGDRVRPGVLVPAAPERRDQSVEVGAGVARVVVHHHAGLAFPSANWDFVCSYSWEDNMRQEIWVWLTSGALGLRGCGRRPRPRRSGTLSSRSTERPPNPRASAWITCSLTFTTTRPLSTQSWFEFRSHVRNEPNQPRTW